MTCNVVAEMQKIKIVRYLLPNGVTTNSVISYLRHNEFFLNKITFPYLQKNPGSHNHGKRKHLKDDDYILRHSKKFDHRKKRDKQKHKNNFHNDDDDDDDEFSFSFKKSQRRHSKHQRQDFHYNQRFRHNHNTQFVRPK